MVPPPTIEFRPKYRRCELSGREAARIGAAIAQLPAGMAGQFHNLDVAPIKQTRHRGVWRLKIPPFRVIFQMAGRKVLVLELDRRDDNTYSHIDRLVYRRQATGVEVLEVPEHAALAAPAPVRGTPPARRARSEVHPNPLMPFTDAQLFALGADATGAKLIRQLRAEVDIGTALAESGFVAEAVELLSDAWHAPSRYLEIFDRGAVPGPADSEVGEEELERRLASPDSSASVASVSGRELDRILAAPIDEWMWFLHPSQARLVRHLPTGPSRVRGGPGTGKTVALLHRARFLVREGFAERVLLATFVRVLPAMWRGLLGSFAPDVASFITTKTVDALAYEIVRDAAGAPTVFADDQRRLPLLEKAIKVTGLDRSPAWLLSEIDTVIAGRAGGSLEHYRGVARVGRGDALARPDRDAAYAAYADYKHRLGAAGATDFAHLRLKATELACQGHGPRFEAILVDEAQDLTEAHLRLLLALDTQTDHRGVMLVGDGQQAIYPGGFSLRSAGLDVRGRSFLLRTNWRNTQRIADVADLVIGEQPVADLENAVQVARDAAPPRRLGVEPELHLVREAAQADELLRDLLSEALTHLAPEEIAILARKNKIVRERAVRACEAAGVHCVQVADLPKEHRALGRVRVGTFEYSKGLEFKLVILVGPSQGDWSVSPYWMSDDADRAAWRLTERRKLFVAMTRARDRLAVVAVRPLPEALNGAASAFAEWDWC